MIFFRIALRNVRRNVRRSLITVFAISFSLLCLIVFQSLKNGLHHEMVSNTISIDAGSIQIHAAGYEPNLAYLKPLPETGKIMDALRQAGITKSASRIKTAALVLAGRKSSTVLLSGIQPENESGVTRIAGDIVKGDYIESAGSILIGEALAEGLGLTPGDKLSLMVQGSLGVPLLSRFTVGGTYRTGLNSFDRTHVFIHLEEAQDFLETGDIVTEIAVRADSYLLNGLAASLREKLPEKIYQVRTWDQIAPDVKELIDLNNVTMNILILIVFAIVAMGIINTMTTVTFERFRELGTLAAIGTPPSGIVRMIVLESFFLGLVAMVIGSAAAAITCSYLASYGIDLTHLTSTNQYFATSHVLKAELRVWDMLWANAVTLLTALIAGIYPACRAALLDPVKAILHV